MSYVEKLIVPEDFYSFDLKVLEDLALEYVNEVDYIICSSDVDVSRFPKSKIVGNKKTDNITDKYKMYKKLHKNFLMPLTFKVSSSHDAEEIVKNYPQKKFITKPIKGTGGFGISWFNTHKEYNNPFILQEFIEGDSVSSSFLAYSNHDISMITTSNQVIGSSLLGVSDFVYCGNVTPLVNSSPKLINISRKISRMFRLLGNNGVDFIMHNKNVYVIEVNPRIPGTFECVEKSFNMNMAQAHIDSCNNSHVNIPHVEKFTVKLVPFALNDGYYNLSGIDGVYDISSDKNLIKKSYPISSIIVSDRILENAMTKAEIIRKKVYNSKI